MAFMNLALDEIQHPRQAYLLGKQFLPAMGNHFGYQLGFLSGALSKDEHEPYIYRGHFQVVSVACPLFEERRPALSFSVNVIKDRPDDDYSMAYHDMVQKVINRVVVITMPDEAGQFYVLLVQSSEQGDDVTDMVFDYAKAQADLTGSFNQIVTIMVAFLTKGDVTHV